MKRRKAIKNTLLGMGGVTLAGANSKILAQTSFDNGLVKNRDFGVQLFTIPSLVDQDLKGTLELLSTIGYKEVEFYGPYSFSAEETKSRWDMLKSQMGLKSNAFFGFTIGETAAMLKEFGLTAPSMHADILTMRTGMTAMLDELSKIGSKYVVIPAIFEGLDTLDGYKKQAEEFNHFGEQMSKYDMRFVYHNHGYEHAEKGGQIPMNVLLENTDTKYVQFELDIFWMSAAGADPIEYLKSYPGKYKMMHLKDAAEEFRFAGDGSTPDQWMAGFGVMVDPGDGVFDIKAMVDAGAKAGVEHFFLERDLAPDPKGTLRNSYKNLIQF